MHRYSRRHRLERVREFPSGVVPPRRVRIYRRQAYYILQWWDPARGRTLNERVDGDIISALLRARVIADSLDQPPGGTEACRSIGHHDLINRYVADLDQRVEAGELSIRTRERYASALSHYLAFIDAAGGRVMPAPDAVERRFALDLSSFLSRRLVSPNGHPHTTKRLLTSIDYVLDTVRAMYEWAADPTRGALLPAQFVNPFLRSRLKRRRPALDPLREPDVTLEMAQSFIETCDDHALRVLAPVLFYGLRPSEAIYLFHEHIDERWITLRCVDELSYATKGLRDKKLPRIDSLVRLWGHDDDAHGLVLLRRSVAEGFEQPSLLGADLDTLIVAYRRRCRQHQATSRRDLDRHRDHIIADAGGITYGHLQREFRRVAKQLHWPRTATLKDFRHLFNTSLANAGMPEHERRYLMGHAPSRDAIVAYTHMHRLHEHFHAAMGQEFQPLLDVVEQRIQRRSDAA